MSTAGKSLVFYFKFWHEMQRLFEEDDGPELEFLQEPEKTKRMVQAVGRKAYEQATELLDACALVIQKRFEEIGRCELARSVGKNWSLSFGIWPKDRNRPAGGNWKMLAGVDILKIEKPLIIPWVWRKGGNQSEEHLAALLADKVQGSSEEFDLKPGVGSVALGKIPLLPDNLVGFDVDRDPLVMQVQQAFAGFSQPNLNLLYSR